MNKLELENSQLKSTIVALRHKVNELSVINSALVNQLGGGVVITPMPKANKPKKVKTNKSKPAGVKPAKVQQPKPKKVKPTKAKVTTSKGVKVEAIEAVDKSTALGIAVRNIFFGK